MTSSLRDIVAIGYARTPIGAFGGGLKFVPAHELGAAAIREALRRSGVDPAEIDDVYFGHTRLAGNGPNPARTAALRAGLPDTVGGCTVEMSCASGLKALIIAAHALLQGDVKLVVAGGQESLSTTPYILKDIRWEGARQGDRILVDGCDAGVDPVSRIDPASTADHIAEVWGVSRAEQDQWALESNLKAWAAQEAGAFQQEIVPVEVPPRGKAPAFAVGEDEYVSADMSFERLSALKPAHKVGGTVTAGNTARKADGAAALVLTTREFACGLGVRPLFSFLATASTAVDPARVGEGPARSIPLALEKAGLALSDADFLEVNESTAAQCLVNELILKWDRAKVNPFGGALALGDPTGMTGARLVGTLDTALRTFDKEYGVAALGGNGGVTCAVVIKRES